MIKRILYSIGILFCCIPVVMAQGRAGSTTSRHSTGLFNRTNAKLVSSDKLRKRTADTITAPAAPDPVQSDTASYALYINCIKQHGWMRGLGKPISDEHASHLSSYYRFSNKNSAGHWTKIENLNGYGELANGSMSTYLLNPFDTEDTGTDPQWREKLKEVVRWEMVGDATGENCIRENAYDRNDNLIYSYIPVRISANRYMGHYVDAWGMPARFRDNDGAKYVVITLNEDGYESEIAYVGDDGYPKTNMWGAYITKNRFDSDGFKLSERSCSAEGTYMLDRAGNCGQLLTCNRYGNALSAANIDQYGQHMRAGTELDWWMYKSTFDRWGREVRHTFCLPDGTPDTTQYGVHYYELGYNDRGQNTYTAAFGIDGQPKNVIQGSWHSIKRGYDRDGNEVLFELRDSDNNFLNNPDGYCACYIVYDGETLMSEKTYATTCGTDTIPVYHFYRDGNRRINKYFKLNRIDVFVDNENGNTIANEFYTLDWKPRMHETYGYHRYMNTIRHSDRKLEEDERYYDTENNYMALSNPVFREYMQSQHTYLHNHRILESDSAAKVYTQRIFEDDRLLWQCQQDRSADFTVTLSQACSDIMGEKARSHYSDVLYYNANTETTIKNNYAYTVITNEYGEIAYARTIDMPYSTPFAFSPIDDSEDNLDENGRPIDPVTISDSLPIAFVIEVADSCAAALGIKSGDVIMKYGNWSYPAAVTADKKGAQALRRAMFLYNDADKKMTVMRRNPLTNSPEPITINLGKGMPRDYGFFVFDIPYTQKEAARYATCFAQGVHDDDPALLRYKSGRTTGMTFFRPQRIQGHLKNVFGSGVHHDAILLGIVVQDSTGLCSSSTGTGLNIPELWFDSGNRTKKIWFTTDLRKVETLEQSYPTVRWDAELWFDSEADANLADNCKKLQQTADEGMLRYMYKLKSDHIDSLIAKYGDAYRAVDNDSIYVGFARVLENPEESGYMAQNGYSGSYLILEWCDWKCTDTMTKFRTIFEARKKKKKNLLLLPLSVDENGNDAFGDIVSLTDIKGKVGVGLQFHLMPFRVVDKEVLSRYREWRRTHPD